MGKRLTIRIDPLALGDSETLRAFLATAIGATGRDWVSHAARLGPEARFRMLIDHGGVPTRRALHLCAELIADVAFLNWRRSERGAPQLFAL